LQANIAARKPFLDFGYSRVNPDGTTQYLQVSGEPMFDHTSRFIGYRGIGMELTDRRQADLKQLRFRLAMGVVQEAVLLFERYSMQIIDANTTALSLLGYSLATLRAQSPQQLGFVEQDYLAQQFDALIVAADSAQLSANQPTQLFAPPAQVNLPERTLEVQILTLRHKNGQAITVELRWHAKKVVDAWIMVAVIANAKLNA
jgi:PAS domain-containing protein